jgi:hypothetical protein
MTMSIRRASDAQRQKLLGEMLSDDWEPGERAPAWAPDSIDARPDEESAIDLKISDEGNISTIAGGPIEETLPGRLECPGCGAVFRVELEWKP